MVTGQINRDSSTDNKDLGNIDNRKGKEIVGKNDSERQKPNYWEPPVSLDHLSETQKEIVRQLLMEECHAFAFDENDIGYIPSLNLHITQHAM